MGAGSGAAIAEAAQTTKAAPGSLTQQLEELKKKQAEMVAERKKVKQVLRNAERKKRRLKKKAKALTDDDLLAVMRLREKKKLEMTQAGAVSKKDMPLAVACAVHAAKREAHGGIPKAEIQ